jgi:hypothetical protein
MENLREGLVVASLVVALLGIPFVATRYMNDLAAKKRRAELELDQAIDVAFRNYIALAAQHPKLAAASYEYEATHQLTDQEQMQLWMLYEVFTSIIEGAFLLYRDEPSKERRDQWKAWERYIALYCIKPSYRQWLETIGVIARPTEAFYDPRFDAVLRKFYKEGSGAGAPKPTCVPKLSAA